MALLPLHLLAVDVLYEEVSSPAGLLSNSRTVESASLVTSSVASLTSGGYSFIEWQLGGVRQEDALGQAVNSFSFTIYEPTVVTAVYLLTNQDNDLDSVPDWFEYRLYGDLDESADSDSDGDRLSLLEEYSRDYNPNISNDVTARGLAWQRSVEILVQLTEDPLYTEKSSPEGLVSEIQQVVELNSNIKTRTLYGTRDGYTFAYWTVDGVRQKDVLGRALDPVSVTVAGDTTAVACHVPTTQDGDSDGIPDWVELNYFGSTNLTADSDSDGDGMDLATEYARDYHPNIGNEITGRGLAWQRSADINVIASTNYVIYTEKTDPEGLVATVEEGLLIGTNITTRTLAGARGGYQFTHWTVNGVRQDDVLGQAMDPVVVSVTGETTAVAYHLPESQDNDGDGIPDWYEVRFAGSTGQSGTSDTDGDSIDLETEYARDYNPNVNNEITGRGLAWQRAAVTYVDLQMFERVRYVMTNGVLRGWFSSSPLEFEGTDLGSNTTPGAGDWDGDGDLDVFVGTSDGTLRVYENQGTHYTMNIWECTAAFGSLVSGWSSLSNAAPSLGDWNGDGFFDLAVGGESGWVRIVSSTEKFLPSQHPAVDYELTISGSSLAIPAFAEVSGDDQIDLLVLLDDGSVRVYPNSGSSSMPFSAGSYSDDLLGTAVPNGTGLGAADVNYDGFVDVLISANDGRIWNFHGNASDSFTLNSKVWAGAGSGFANRLTLGLGDLDGDNDIDALCGYAGGGLMYLRDPRIGIPSGLQAHGGPRSVLLEWDPNRSARLVGYYIYRSDAEDGSFVRLMDHPWALNSWVDKNIQAGASCYYYVTAVSEAYYPGNSISREAESLPSQTVAADTGAVVLWMPDYFGKAGEIAVLQVNVEHGSGISGQGMDIRITYDSSLLTPLSQISTNATVNLTALTAELVITDNSAVATGELQITGSGGVVQGDGHLFDVLFQVSTNVSSGQAGLDEFAYAALQSEEGSLNVDYSDTALFTVTAIGYFFGDVNGDGVVDMDDHHHLLWLIQKNTRDPFAEEISAGDMNGNGQLDHRDIPLLLNLIHEQ